jgi:hypothetical protein
MCLNLTSHKTTVFFPQKLKTVILYEVKFSLGVQVIFFRLKTHNFSTKRTKCVQHPLRSLCAVLCCEDYETVNYY